MKTSIKIKVRKYRFSFEKWFSILARKVIRRGNFSSRQDLKNKIEDFIEYFNKTMAKPFKWTYQGKPLVA